MATRRIVVVAMLAAGFAGAARADDVYMKNGRVFEGVIVTALDDEQIRIRLAFGELALAANLVARVVDSESDLERYLDRRRQLVESSASAGEWLELAKWARNRDLDHGFREAALTAAAQDPTMDELAPYLRSLGYVLDKAAGLWVPYSNLESKSARSPVRSPEPQSAATPQSTEEHLSRAVELLAAAQLARETRALEAQAQPSPRAATVTPTGLPGALYFPLIAWSGWSGWTFPAAQTALPPVSADPTALTPITRRPQHPVAQAMLRRQPGSLISVDTLAR